MGKLRLGVTLTKMDTFRLGAILQFKFCLMVRLFLGVDIVKVRKRRAFGLNGLVNLAALLFAVEFDAVVVFVVALLLLLVPFDEDFGSGGGSEMANAGLS